MFFSRKTAAAIISILTGLHHPSAWYASLRGLCTKYMHHNGAHRSYWSGERSLSCTDFIFLYGRQCVGRQETSLCSIIQHSIYLNKPDSLASTFIFSYQSVSTNPRRLFDNIIQVNARLYCVYTLPFTLQICATQK